jgi:DNA-binding FadR family transcriptional regulator
VNAVLPGGLLRRPKRMWQEVVDVLLPRIVTGHYAEGSELPTEAELVEELGVSRPPVREAMKVLQEKGLVRMGQGRRSVVLPRAVWNALDPDVLTTELANPGRHARVFEDLSFVRIALEAQMARQAAERATDEQIGEMGRQLEQMAAFVEHPDRYVDHDVRFHDLVVAAGHNQIALAVMHAITEPLRQSRRMTNQIPGGVRRAHEFHTTIYQRIADRDPDGAAAAMREHLEWSWQRFAEMVAAGMITDEGR